MGLKEFLVSVRKSLAELPSRKRVHIVIGNESCDLDSAVSAIVYAYFLNQIKAKLGTTYVPILNTPRKSFRLRLETVYFLDKHGITAEDLTFVSDLDLRSLIPKPGGDLALAVTLVDHHVLSEVEACLEPYVIQVFDHRPQEGSLPDSWSVTLEHVGSCCSLIARELLASETFQFDSRVAELLLGTILTDTGNMSASDRIGTPGDHEQLVKLKAFLAPSISATSIYEGIQQAKFDLSSLTVREMLEKDMKIVKGTQITVAMSSVTKDLEEIMCDPDLLQHAREFCEELPADVAIIMTVVMGNSGIRRRCIAVYSPNRVYREQITDVITGATSPNLDLQPLSPGHDLADINMFVQNNFVISRKGVLPLVRNFLTGEVTSSGSSHDFFTANTSGNAVALTEADQAAKQEKVEEENEEMRRHINLAKAHQCEQFRTSQDRYDLAAVGNDALISPSLSSDSDLGNVAAAVGEHPHAHMAEFSLSHPDLPIADSLLAGPSATENSAGVRRVDFDPCQDQSAPGTGEENLLIDIGGGGDNELTHSSNADNLLFDLASGDNQVNGGSTTTPPIVINCHEPFQLMCPANISMTDFFSSSGPTSGQGSKVPSYPETPPNSYMGSSFSLNRETQLPSFNSSEMVKRIQQKKAALAGHSGQRRGNYEDDESDGLAIGGSGGGGSLVSPAVPQNSYIDPSSGFDFMSASDPGSAFPRLSSSDALMERVNEKRSQFEWSVESREENEEDINEAVGASGSVGIRMQRSADSGGGGSLDPPVPYTPQNSYVEGGFDTYSRSNLPSMNSAEMVAKIKAKQSAMFGSNGSSSRVSRSSHGSDDSGGCRSPDVVMASGSSGGGDTGRSVSSKASRGASLDSPQQPYTPQNSYRDSMGLLEYRNRLPDLNEVAERLSTEKDAENSKRGKGRNNHRSHSTSDDNREEQEEELDVAAEGNSVVFNMVAGGPNNLQPLAMSGVALLSSTHPHHQQTGSPRKSSSRSHSDSQNTMSDVDSLMSVSTDVGTPLSDNVVATGLASQILRGEMALSGRKDTTDSDVFAPPKTGDEEEDGKEKASGQDVERVTSSDEKRRHLKFSLTQDPRQVIPNGPVAEEDLIYVSGGDQASGFNTHSFSREDLFSPVEHSRDDLGFVNIAENIVAESIAAALHVQGGRSGADNQLRWMDQISSEVSVSPENVVAANLSNSILHEGSDRWQPDNPSTHLDQAAEENLVSRNIVQDMMPGLVGANGSETICNANSSDPSSNNNKEVNEHSRASQLPGEDQSAIPDQAVSDVALNELAYEIAHELIQNVLENFPEISSQIENQEQRSGQPVSGGTTETGSHNRVVCEGPSRRIGVVENSMLGASPGENSQELDDTVHSLSSSEPRKFSTDSNSSASTSCSDRKWSRDTDSAMTIVEDQIVTSFPERQEQEEEIKSFPGRKFSKSDDFPTRRFSREEHASRRSSRITDQPGEQYEEINVAPDGLETDYLPNMDPLQGNLDIIDSNFSKITDTDREVVEGESFRKVSGQELGISPKFEGNEAEEEAELGGVSKGDEEENGKLVSAFQGAAVAEKGIMKKDLGGDSVFEEGGEQVASRATPRTKKKIRVSFSEDIEDEAGDSNSSCDASASAHSPRSTLRSPPPFAPSDPDVQGACEDNSAFAEDDDDVITDSQTRQPKEVYFTSAGRISIASGGELDQTGNTGGSVSSPLPGLPRPDGTREEQHQVGGLAQRSGDQDVFGVTPDPSFRCEDPSLTTSKAGAECVREDKVDKAARDFVSSPSPQLTFFQPPEHYINSERLTQSAVNETHQSQPSQLPNPVTCDPCVNPDPRVDDPAVCGDSQPACLVSSSSNHPQISLDKSGADEVAPGVASKPDAPGPVGADNRPVEMTKSPKLRQVSGPQPATFDPLTSGRGSTHSRNLSSVSLGSVKGAVYSDEWQDDDIAGIAAQSGIDIPPEDHQRKKIRPDPNFARNIADGDDDAEEVDDDDDDDDEAADNNSDIGDLEWENDTPIQQPVRPGIQPTLSQDGGQPGPSGGGADGTDGAAASQRWKRVSVSGSDFNIDMQAVEPYRSVLSHGGYYAEGLNAIIVFYGCNLPSRRRDDYSYIMNHLFHYVVHTLEELVADDYVIIYFHGSTPRHKMPGLGWLRRCYQSIDRRLKKNLKGLFLVHPTLWLRTIVTMTRPFISSKFSSKLRFVRTLEELNTIVPMDNVTIPDAIAQLERLIQNNPQFLEEQDEQEKRELKREKAKAKQREKDRKRQEKERKKEEKLAAKEEKRKLKATGSGGKEETEANK